MGSFFSKKKYTAEEIVPVLKDIILKELESRKSDSPRSECSEDSQKSDIEMAEQIAKAFFVCMCSK